MRRNLPAGQCDLSGGSNEDVSFASFPVPTVMPVAVAVVAPGQYLLRSLPPVGRHLDLGEAPRELFSFRESPTMSAAAAAFAESGHGAPRRWCRPVPSTLQRP
jgi:hypothetical protein